MVGRQYASSVGIKDAIVILMWISHECRREAEDFLFAF